MKDLKLAVGAILTMILLPLLAYFGFGAVMLAFSGGDGPGWAVIFLVMFFLPLLVIFGAVRRKFGPLGFGSGTGRRRRRKQKKTLTLPDGTVVENPLAD